MYIVQKKQFVFTLMFVKILTTSEAVRSDSSLSCSLFCLFGVYMCVQYATGGSFTCPCTN